MSNEYFLLHHLNQCAERFGCQLKISGPTPDQLPRLARLNQLTPGDFVTVARQHRCRPITSSADMLSALEAESAVDDGGKTTTGFIH